MDRLTERIPNAKEGFRLVFSDKPFDDSECLERVDAASSESREGHPLSGLWTEYLWKAGNLRGWLCPNLMKYFSEPPDYLFVRAEALPIRYFVQSKSGWKEIPTRPKGLKARGATWRSTEVGTCGTCWCQSNRWFLGGFPCLGVRLCCPGHASNPDLHNRLDAKIYKSLDDEHPKSYIADLKVEIDELRQRFKDIPPDIVELAELVKAGQ